MNVQPDRNWKLIRLILNDQSEERSEIELLRSPDWIEGHQAQVGGSILLNMPEMSVEGMADVLAIDPCLELEKGVGRLVTGTFKHTSGEVYDLKLASESKPIWVTGTHPFWSVDREDWVSVLDLEIGETLKTLEGTTVVESRVRRPEPESVYNIEVHGEHVYRVGESGVLVHNASLEKLDCAVAAIPPGKLYRGFDKSGMTQFLSYIAAHFGIDEAKRDVAKNEADPTRK